MTAPRAEASPAAGARSAFADTLRGVALVGICVANLPWIAGTTPAASQGTTLSDTAARLLVVALVDGKFFVLFSLLFGFGFERQLARIRAGTAAPRTYARRLAGLFVLGALHAALLYTGDILATYALLGWALWAVRDWSDARLLRLAGACTALAAIAFGLLAWNYAGEGDTARAAAEAEAARRAYGGGFAEALARRVQDLPAGVAVVLLFNAPLAFAAFCAGLVAGRRGLLDDPARLAAALPPAPLLALGAVVGNGGAVAAYRLADAWSVPAYALLALGAPSLSALYVMALARAWRLARARAWLAACFAPGGRMSLSNYLGQSLAANVLVAGWGLGLHGVLGAAALLPLAFAIAAAGLAASALWLRVFRIGPAEWALRVWAAGRRACGDGWTTGTRRAIERRRRTAPMPTRESALDRAATFFDSGKFRDLLASLVAIPSTAQEEGREADLDRYLNGAIRPWLERMGFAVAIHPNPVAGFGPILSAERIEDPARPTILLYGHGDTVRGLDEQWRAGLAAWALTEEGDRWYGRGTADNKGQHALNLAALEAVLAERGGKLGANVRVVLEMAEERGSKGLREFVAANAQALKADALIASDGPRVDPAVPTIATGTRGTWHFDLVVKLREGGVHSGHWGGLTRDPAIILAHALASLMDRNGRILVRDLLPRNGVPAAVRGVLDGCPVAGGGGAATIDEGWGEPGLTSAEKIYGWNSLIVLAMTSGRPENPVNAVAPDARAHCQIRYTVDTDPAAFEAAIRRHLDAEGFGDLVKVEGAFTRMAASRTAPDHPWVRWAQASMERSLGRAVQIIPNSSGGLPGDVFVDHLGLPLVWVPHSYNGCKQHGPDEHLLTGPAREGLLAFAGMWWDLGESGTPPRR